MIVTPLLLAAAASVSVAPASGLDPAGATISVGGQGFNATGNNKFGVYVVFGPRRANFSTDSLAFGAARWVHPGGSGAGQAPMNGDGSFSTALAVKAKYKDGHGSTVDCTRTPCYVITMAAHGLADRSQDTFTRVTFKGAAAEPSKETKTTRPSTTATPGTTAPAAPGATATPGKTAAGTPGDPSQTPLTGETPVAAQTVTTSDASPAWPFWTLSAVAAAAAFGLRRFARR
ncbi:hypothetical protein [Actinocorallia longicatena]|uniref:Neocarzinostatin family protein n=1 Tax=Actinocorallia longicatena TaxID=111803 RepID=A0ABP6Q8V3_9ACTN